MSAAPPPHIWSQLEANEDSWYRRWCREIDLGQGRLFLNSAFRGDPVFNHLTRIRARPTSWRRLLRRAEQRFANAGENVVVFLSPLTRPPGLAAQLPDAGYRLSDRMQIRTATWLPQASKGQVTVEIVKPTTLATWTQVFADAFELPVTWMPEVDRRVRGLQHDPATALFLARLARRAAGVVALHRRGRIAGIYCLGTRPMYRRLGVARTLLRTAQAYARRTGVRYVCLQHLATDNVDTFYEKRGFLRVFAREIWVRSARNREKRPEIGVEVGGLRRPRPLGTLVRR